MAVFLAGWRRPRMFAHVDWVLLLAAVSISLLGLATMRSFSWENLFFERQIMWTALSVGVFLLACVPEYGFLRQGRFVALLFFGVALLLALVYGFGAIIMGSQNRFDLGLFFVQPSDPAKVVLVALLAKYFARRHIEIQHIRHIALSGAYSLVFFVLVFFQPDLGSAIIIFSIWFGMVLVGGISWKHLFALCAAGVIVMGLAWQYGLHDYQKERVLTFLHPLEDIRGAGYNAYQSTVAVGSGELLGKGVGYGTQSKLQFLPEYQTDFIFAAYAEEWGFFGVIILFSLFGIILFRMIGYALHAPDNFAALFAVGIAIYFLSQFIVHVGMNIGLLPITGTTLPLMSYGGSHLLTEYAALGALMGMRRHARATVRARDETELIGAI
jgi:rod shape determining protein RodA